VADWLLEALGAAPAPDTVPADLTPVLIDPLAEDEFGAGLPPGTLGHCTGVALALGALVGRATSGVAVAMQLRLPEVMAAVYGSGFEMRPAPPLPAPGGGWVHADVGSARDREDFDRLLDLLPSSATAWDLAEAAQAWRLPVCDYRLWASERERFPITFETGDQAATQIRNHPPRPLRILELSNMWAGPLATWLLQGLGASVTKVEPSFRPDGFRALSGGGIYPDGQPCQPGRDSAMWNALNHGKTTVDLDLRAGRDRDRFLDLVESSDVVIDSFSPRVMPNFGLDLPPGPLYASIPAFPRGPQRDWVAYGSGVHACSGLADIGSGRFAPASVSYPDPVAGFTAALGVMAAVIGRDRAVAVGRVESSLAASVQPLVAHTRTGPTTPLGDDPSGLGRRLAEHGRAFGWMEERLVCGRPRPHPRGVFSRYPP
jgi:hypothetical protein